MIHKDTNASRAWPLIQLDMCIEQIEDLLDSCLHDGCIGEKGDDRPICGWNGPPLIVIVLVYCGLKGIIYLKKDSSVRVAPQFHLGRVTLLPLSNHRCPMSENARSWLCKSLVYFNSTTALVHPHGNTLWMQSTAD